MQQRTLQTRTGTLQLHGQHLKNPKAARTGELNSRAHQSQHLYSCIFTIEGHILFLLSRKGTKFSSRVSSGFLPQSKDMQIRLIGESKLSVSHCLFLSVSPVIV